LLQTQARGHFTEISKIEF